MTYNGIVDKKLSYLKDQLHELRSWKLGTLEDFRRNTMLRRAAERELQVCIEIMIDLCERIIAVEGLAPAENSVGNLEKAAKLGIIKDVETYTSMVRFRNFVVHRYEEVDPNFVYDIINNKLADFDNFIEEVETAIEQRRDDESK